MKLVDFLAPLSPDINEPIYERAFPPKGAQGNAVKIVASRAQLSTDRDLQARLIELNKTHGIYYVVNAGGDCDAEITRFNSFFAEIDDRPIAEQHAILDAAPLSPSIRVETLKSVHAYWPIVGPCSADQWREMQLRLIDFLGADPKIKNPSRLMRLPGFDHLSITDSGQLMRKRITVAAFDPERRFSREEMLAAFPPVESPKQSPAMPRPLGEIPPSAFDIRQYTHQLAGYHESRRGWAYGKCPAHSGKGTNSLFIELSSGAYGCFAGCPTDEIRAALGCPKRRDGATILTGNQPIRIQRPATAVLVKKPTRPVETTILELHPKRPENTMILEVNR